MVSVHGSGTLYSRSGPDGTVSMVSALPDPVTSNTTEDVLPASVVEVGVESVGSAAVVLLAGDVGPVFGASDLAHAGTTLEQVYLGYAGKPDTGDLGWLGHR